MAKLVCSKCMTVHHIDDGSEACPVCGGHRTYDFSNSDEYLKEEVPRVEEERRRLGLHDLTGDLQCVVINVEPRKLIPAAAEFLDRTGFDISDSFQDARFRTVVLSVEGSADILLRCRLSADNPFLAVPGGPKTRDLPGTRLETFYFRSRDIASYMDIQRSRGVEFLESESVAADGLLAEQTIPSSYTGLSIGIMETDREDGSYRTEGAADLELDIEKPDCGILRNIGLLDHTATRVRAEHRDAAIIEFMELTGYDFQFAIYVKIFNSITNVARLSGANFAMVLTSGIVPDTGGEDPGPTQQFIRNYGTRVHHMALRTEEIRKTWNWLVRRGQEYLVELVGSEEEGLRQTFTVPSPSTLLVTELIERYGDFDGFFTRSNVTLLTGATRDQ